MSAIHVPSAPVVLSTASVFPETVPTAFEIAAKLGYDGIEVLVTRDPDSRDTALLRRLSDYHQIPVLAVHSPCLSVNYLPAVAPFSAYSRLIGPVWGRDPWERLVRSTAMAEELGAKVVVVHPAFSWQGGYARGFETGIKRMQNETDVVFAVENMYPARMGNRELYAPSWNLFDDDNECKYRNVTLDLSHTAMSGSDAMDMTKRLGGQLSHLHLADGNGGQNMDEHLIPGRGTQPCAEVLEHLATEGFEGQVVLEVNTRKSRTREAREMELAEALAFSRLHFAKVREGSADHGRRDAGTWRSPTGTHTTGQPGAAARSGTAGTTSARSHRERVVLRRQAEAQRDLGRVWVVDTEGTVVATG